MINLNPNVSGAANAIKRVWEANSGLAKTNVNETGTTKVDNGDAQKTDFADTVKAVENYVSKVDDLQQSSNVSIKDLLSGKNEDINSVVSAMAKADISFKLLVGVRNKLIEAYKQTMNMPI